MKTSACITRLLGIFALCLLPLTGGAAAPERRFETPERAVAAMATLIGKADTAAVEGIFGKGSMELFQSGDPEDDRSDFQRVKEMIDEKVDFEEYDENTRVALFGNSSWPWPIPLVRQDGLWHFDTEAGRDEVLNRRIGSNELWTITALREVVAAQQEYHASTHSGTPLVYAARFRSTEGKHDGLWWPVAEGEAESPLGDLLAESEIGPDMSSAQRPFHGYHYRMLDGQGRGAPGGERSYLNKQGQLSGGFAVVAWPAKYGNSGIMTFQVNHRGIVFQKDLGEDTDKLASAITRFDLDSSWDPTADAVTDAEQVTE